MRIIASPSANVDLGACGEQRLEELAGQRRQLAALGHELLVATAVEEQRSALAVACELDLTEEQRVIAAPVGAHDPCDQVSERARDERRLVHDLERRLGQVVPGPAREAVGEPGLTRFQHAHAVAGALVQETGELRAAIERDEDERRTERDRHERVRSHAVHLIARPGREDGDAGREHPERAAKRDRRVPFQPFSELELLAQRHVEGRLGQGDRKVELARRSV